MKKFYIIDEVPPMLPLEEVHPLLAPMKPLSIVPVVVSVDTSLNDTGENQ